MQGNTSRTYTNKWVLRARKWIIFFCLVVVVVVASVCQLWPYFGYDCMATGTKCKRTIFVMFVSRAYCCCVCVVFYNKLNTFFFNHVRFVIMCPVIFVWLKCSRMWTLHGDRGKALICQLGWVRQVMLTHHHRLSRQHQNETVEQDDMRMQRKQYRTKYICIITCLGLVLPDTLTMKKMRTKSRSRQKCSLTNLFP